MKTLATVLLVFAAGSLASCSKSRVQQVSGTINGVPTITLYGTSGAPADYVFLSTDPAYKEVSYNGEVYSFFYGTTRDDIYLSVTPSEFVGATLDTVNSKIVMTINASSANIFASLQYSSM